MHPKTGGRAANRSTVIFSLRLKSGCGNFLSIGIRIAAHTRI